MFISLGLDTELCAPRPLKTVFVTGSCKNCISDVCGAERVSVDPGTVCVLTVRLRQLLPGQFLRRSEAVHQFLTGHRWRGRGQGGRRRGGVTEVILLEDEGGN